MMKLLVSVLSTLLIWTTSYWTVRIGQYATRNYVWVVNQAIEKFDYVNGGNCKFCAIGRASKMICNSVLLSKLDRAFDQHDPVMVTFGGSHALAIEPALKHLMRKRRPS